MKFTIILSILFSTFLYSNNIKEIISCSNAYSEMINLNQEQSSGYSKDSLSLEIILDKKLNEAYVKSNSSVSKLRPLGQTTNSTQFIEMVTSGDYILYTLIGGKLTIQKTYSLLEKPTMVNIILTCTKRYRKTVNDVFFKFK